MKSKPSIKYITEFRFCGNDHFRILKGISILLVVLAHFCGQYLNFPHLMPLQGVAAAVFLLCSGYGVSESFNNKKGLTHYWENKAIKVWLPSVVVTVLLSFVTTGNVVGWVEENPVALYGWFLYLLFGEYLAFWLAFYFLEDKTVRLVSLFAVSLVGFFLVGSQKVAAQVFSFPMGVLFSQMGWKYAVREMKLAVKVLLSAVLAVVAAAMYFLSGILPWQLLTNACCAAFCLSTAVLIYIGVYFAQKIGIFGVFAPVGTISYALYLLHEPVLTLLAGRLEWRVAAVVIAGLFVLAALYSWLCKLLVHYNKKLRRNKSARLKGSL